MADPMNATYATLANYLNSLGLGQLGGVDADGNPTGWLWNQLQAGVDTADELNVAIESTNVWRDQYGVILQQRQDAAAGKPVQVMSVEEVNAYRKNAAQVMRAAGLPATFYDTNADVDKLILQGISIAELADKTGESLNRARSVAPEIRQAFENFYGVGQGDTALAAYFLDPEHTVAQLDRQSRAAYAAGLGAKYGISIDKTTAEGLTTFAPSDAAVNQGLGQVAALSGVTDNGLFDSGNLGDETAIKSVFEQDAAATRAINRRVTERRSINSSAVGGAALTSQGLLGAGSS